MWNSVGIIRQYNTDQENSIDVEFHDTSVHHALHINNNPNYTMAALSVEALVLATEGESDSPRYTHNTPSNWIKVPAEFILI